MSLMSAPYFAVSAFGLRRTGQVAVNVVEGTLSICDQLARVVLDPGATHSYVYSAFALVMGRV